MADRTAGTTRESCSPMEPRNSEWYCHLLATKRHWGRKKVGSSRPAGASRDRPRRRDRRAMMLLVCGCCRCCCWLRLAGEEGGHVHAVPGGPGSRPPRARLSHPDSTQACCCHRSHPPSPRPRLRRCALPWSRRRLFPPPPSLSTARSSNDRVAGARRPRRRRKRRRVGGH